MISDQTKKVWILVFVVWAAVIGLWIWFNFKSPPTIRNVLLISIDTCRADHLSCYGFERPTTPRIDEIARQGLLFEQAISPAPLTLPAHCSLLTGVYPPSHRVHDNYGYKLGDSQHTLAEILKENGFRTGAVISSFVLDRKFGTHQGFDEYYDRFDPSGAANRAAERRGEDASRQARKFLAENKDHPFFLFLHFYDPHDAYEPPEPYASEYADDLYAGEIAYTDHCLGQVIDRLRELDLYDSTLLVIIGDHGEALGEHAESTHGYFIYQSTLQVPLIIRAPGKIKPARRPANTSLVDVTPTILACLDLPIPDHIQGINLVTFSPEESPESPDRYIYCESLTGTKFGCNPLRGVYRDQWQYIHTNRPELYDLSADPRQANNLAPSMPQRVRLMSGNLEDLNRQLEQFDSGDSRLALDAASRKSLESLGYVGEMMLDHTFIIDPEKKDAKDLIQCYEYREEAASLITDKRYDEARPICEKMLALWPDVPIVHLLMMTLAFQADQPDLVIEHARPYLTLSPEVKYDITRKENFVPSNSLESAYNMIALSALRIKNYHMAMEFCNRLLRNRPDSFIAHNTLAQAYLGQNLIDPAISIWIHLLRLYPDNAEVYRDIALAYYRLGDIAQMIRHLKAALKIKPDLKEVIVDSEGIFQVEQQINQQITQYQKELARNPDDPVLHDQLALVLYQSGAYRDAIDHWRQAIQLKPDWTKPYIELARLLARSRDSALRNPPEAVILAYKAAELTQFEDAAVLEALCLAYDAAGKYDDAISAAERTYELAAAKENESLTLKMHYLIMHLNLKKQS